MGNESFLSLWRRKGGGGTLGGLPFFLSFLLPGREKVCGQEQQEEEVEGRKVSNQWRTVGPLGKSPSQKRPREKDVIEGCVNR